MEEMKMKKSLVPLFFFLLFSCSNEGFKSEIAASSQKKVWCQINGCHKISESLCSEMGGVVVDYDYNECESSSSSVDDVSSSSDVDVSSSSRIGVSSSSRGSSSSSRGSSSSVVDGGSSSGGDASSSSGGASSSSEDDVSSSSIGDSSSSSSSMNSSSSVVASSSSLVSPSLVGCSPFPYYVLTTKREYIKNLVSIEGNTVGCGDVTYSVSSTGGGPGGGNIASITSNGDSISFTNASASSTVRNLTIRANAQCNGTPLQYKDCPVQVVVVAADYRDAKCNHEGIFSVNLAITRTPTVIDYACCEPKSDYIITQCGANFTLSIDGSVAVTSSNNSANLPNHTPIPEPNKQCTEYGGSPGGTLYRYPKRILMTVTDAIPAGGFSCNSW
jgi:hypothetical protein